MAQFSASTHARSLAHSLTHSLARSLARSLTHSLTHSLQKLRKCSLFRDVQGEIDAWAPCVELCHLLCFVCERAVPPQGRPRAAGRSSHTSFSQVSTRFFQAGGSLGCFASPCVELCHLLCFVCGRGSASTRPPPGRGGPATPVSAR